MSAYRFPVTQKQLEQVFIAIIQMTDDNNKLVGSPSWLVEAAIEFDQKGQVSITFENSKGEF